MSHGYNEDWQRRKSLLIRSLFYDIPVLSPVPEESDQVIDFIPSRAEISRPLDVISRSYSPLPPLIIEKVPNRHDEPEEYYQKLYIKIKKIYRKLFIENKDLSSGDYDLINSNNTIDDFNQSENIESDNSIDYNVTQIQQVKEHYVSISHGVREDLNSTNSNGYGADFESNDSESNNSENNSDLNKDEVMRYEKEESSNERIDEPELNEEEPLTSLQNDNNVINEREFTNVETDDTDSCTEESNNTVTNDQESSQSKESNNIRNGNQKFHEYIRHDNNKRVNVQQIIEEHSNNIRMDEQEQNESEEHSKSTNNYKDTVVYESELKSKESKQVVFSYGIESMLTCVEAMEEDVEAKDSEGAQYSQITTEALIHVDGSQETTEKESRVYEDSVKSIILPFSRPRRLNEARKIDEEDKIDELAELEDNEDPENDTTDLNDTEANETNRSIEVMRTPQPELSIESLPMSYHSDPDIVGRTEFAPNLTTVTTHSQIGEDTNNITERHTSDEINNILTSIFNESKDETSAFTRKRKLYEDISVQTSDRVTWDELRRNFFVGTPKIFRLCSCADHICDISL